MRGEMHGTTHLSIGREGAFHESIHIGVAVDTERALVTPVIRNAHQLSLPAIARELRRLTLAARQESLTPEEVTGATFTISNLGMYDIDTFHAIIVPGQSAILAVGKVTKRGVVIEEDGNPARLEIRPVMKVSLSADHRVLDGASGSRFLHQLKVFLEYPYLLIMTFRGHRSRQRARWLRVSMGGSAVHRGSCRQQNVSDHTGRQSSPRGTYRPVD